MWTFWLSGRFLGRPWTDAAETLQKDPVGRGAVRYCPFADLSRRTAAPGGYLSIETHVPLLGDGCNRIVTKNAQQNNFWDRVFFKMAAARKKITET